MSGLSDAAHFGGGLESSLMSGLSDVAHFGLKNRSEVTQPQYLNFLFDEAQILS